MVGRSKAYEAIIKNEPIRGPRIPESFNVLVKELQSLGLAVDLIRTDHSGEVDTEVDAETVISAETDLEVTDLGSEKLMVGDVVVADMPLVDLAGESEDEFAVMAEGSEAPDNDATEVNAEMEV